MQTRTMLKFRIIFFYPKSCMGFQMFASPPQTAHAAVLCQIDTAIVNMLTAKYIDQQKGPVFQLSLNQRNHLQEKKKDIVKGGR